MYITMTKTEAEKKLNKTLTNQEYCQYIYKLNFGNKEKKKNQLMDNKAEFLETLEKESDKKYYNSSYEYALKFDNNYLLFERPSIETRFCFGHGQNGITTEEEQQAAFDMQHYADTNEKHFIEENLKGLNQKIKTMKAFLSDDKYTYCENMYKKTKDFSYIDLQYISKIYLCKNYNNTLYLYYCENPEYDNKIKYCTVIKELEKTDIEKILAIYEKQKENFSKRLNTYLKKYGLSKIKTWTYLVD